MDCSLPASSVHGISQARVLKWVAISFSRRSSQPAGSDPCLLHCRQILYRLIHHTCHQSWQIPMWFSERGSDAGSTEPSLTPRKLRKWTCYSLSRVWLFATPWTVALQAPLSMGFPRQEYWSGLPIPLLQGIFPTQGLNPGLPHCRQILYRLSYQGSPEN